MPKLKWKKLLNTLLLAGIFAITLLSVFQGENLPKVLELVKEAEVSYALAAIACVLLFVAGEASVIHYLMRTLETPVRFYRCYTYSCIGFFYSCVTPSASGGQPMQVMSMRRDGIPVAVSTVVLAIVTITYKLVLVVSGLCVVVIRPAALMACLEPVEPFIYLGLLLNTACIVFLMMVVFDPKLVRTLTMWVLNLLNRIRPMRRKEKIEARLERLLEQYHGTAEYFRTHKHVMGRVFVITLLQRYVLFVITWLIYRSFGLREYTMPFVTSLQAMISVGTDMLPLPGGMGASENLFLEIFEPVFGEALVLPGMMLSRGISYYSQLLFSGAVTLASTFLIGRKNKKGGETS